MKVYPKNDVVFTFLPQVFYAPVAMETVQAGTLTELVYGIELRKQADAQAMINDLRLLNDNNKVALITGQQEVDL